MSREYAPRAAAAGCIVIDNTSEFRYEDDIPLVVPEVNPQALDRRSARTAASSPIPTARPSSWWWRSSRSTTPSGIERINVATYQSVSGAGREAVEELARQSIAAAQRQGPGRAAGVIAKQIAFNCVPQIDAFQDNGYTRKK